MYQNALGLEFETADNEVEQTLPILLCHGFAVIQSGAWEQTVTEITLKALQVTPSMFPEVDNPPVWPIQSADVKPRSMERIYSTKTDIIRRGYCLITPPTTPQKDIRQAGRVVSVPVIRESFCMPEDV